MTITNHIYGGSLYKTSPNHGGALQSPTLLVMHFTASGGGKQAADYLSNPAAKASAHIVVGESGDTYQIVPFNVKAWHAGVSTWRGRPNCNDYSIGIEIANWGGLAKRADGFYSWTGVKIDPARVLHAKNKLGVDGYWETYPETQLKKVEDLTKEILAAYPSIREIVGHEDVAPVRKTDPGPAFPLDRYKALIH